MRRGVVAAPLVLLLGVLGPSVARAAAAPWVAMGDDVRVVASPRVEVNLRLALIRQARRTIDVANYDQRADAAVALPLASALREAADRGVKVRFIISWATEMLFDNTHKIGRLFIDPPARVPIEYLVVGGPTMEDRGWGMLDSIHEKLLIVDEELLLTTGRGFGDIYLHWLDTAFAIRGPLVAQSQQCFNVLWDSARRVQPLFVGNIRWHQHPRRRPPVHLPTAATRLSVEEQREHDEVHAWLRRAPAAPATVGRGRALHFDLLRQLRGLAVRPIEVTLDDRIEELRDPVVDAVVDRLAVARRVRMVAMNAVLHPRLKRALIEARHRGANITLFINSRAPSLAARREITRAQGIVWAVELPDLDDLLTAGVEVHVFTQRPSSPWLFLHRKVAVFDDAVIIGSHNFNLPSSTYLDEVSFEIEDPRLASTLAQLFDADLATTGAALDPELVHRERRRLGHRVLRWLSLPYIAYM